MEELESIFKKWPDWLRWILFLPIALLSAFLFRLLSVLTAFLMGDILYEFIPEILFTIAEVSGFLIGVYTVVPSRKRIFLIIFASVVICLCGGMIFVNIARGYIFIYNNLIQLIAVVTSIVLMCSFVEESNSRDEKQHIPED